MTSSKATGILGHLLPVGERLRRYRSQAIGLFLASAAAAEATASFEEPS